MELLTTSEMAKKWDISRRRVTTLCAEGRIEGSNFEREYLAYSRKYRKTR